MELTLYPNGELRVTKASPRPVPRSDRGRPAPSCDPGRSSCQSRKSCDFSRPRPGYGSLPSPRRFTLRARRTISRAGGVFSPAREKRLLFLTGTLPGSTDAAMSAIAEFSSWIVHQLLTRIPRLVGVPAAALRWIWVWEFQRRGALHWHCAIEVPGGQEDILSGFRTLWIAVIRGLSRRSGVDCCERREGGTWAENPDVWRIDAQVARKSPSNYLAKYLSKGQAARNDNSSFHPARWYGCSRRILRELRSKTLHGVVFASANCPASLNEQELDVLERILSLRPKVTAFQHRFRPDCWTMVCYLDGSDRGDNSFSNILLEVQGMGINRRKGNPPEEKEQGSFRDRFLLHASRVPRVWMRMLNDVSTRDRDVLSQWKKTGSGDLRTLRHLSKHARSVLIWEGCLPGDVKPKATPAPGVDIRPSKSLEPGGRKAMQMNFFEDPFIE